MISMVLRSGRCWPGLLLVFLCATGAEANSVTLAWDPSTGDDVAGYRLMYGTTSGSYPQQINVGNTTAFTVSSLPDGIYYFVVQAYSSSGMASPASNQVVVTLGTAIITTCSTPDPFSSLGGGTCYNGGWLPPGMVPPDSSQRQPRPRPRPRHR